MLGGMGSSKPSPKSIRADAAEGLRLIKAFEKIVDPAKRREIIRLAEEATLDEKKKSD